MPTPSRGKNLIISLGPVAVGVKYAPLVREQRTRGRLLCREHRLPVRYQTVCEHGEVCETVVGYEHAGKFLVLPDRRALESERDGYLELKAFVPVDSIDPLYIERTHLVWPQAGNEASYDLLAEVLRSTRKALVGTTVLGKSTKVVALRYHERGCIIAQVCTYDANIAWHDLELVTQARKKRAQGDNKWSRLFEAAIALFETLPDSFDYGAVTDEYDERLRRAVEMQARGEAFVLKKKPTPPMSLREALEVSLSEAAKKRKARTVRPKRRSI